MIKENCNLNLASYAYDDLGRRTKVPGSRAKSPGDWYELPNGQGGFGVRDSRNNGRTVDVNIPGVPDVTKIHQKP